MHLARRTKPIGTDSDTWEVCGGQEAPSAESGAEAVLFCAGQLTMELPDTPQ